MELGNPNNGGNTRKKKNYFHIKQGSQVFRILPPMGALAQAGIWSRYYEVHFGYKHKEGYMKPFQSCEQKSRDRKMIEIDDPAKERLKRLEGQLKAIEERHKAQPSAELAAAIEKLKTVVGFDGQYSLEKRHYMNAVNDKGEIGLLALKHREKLALEEALKKIETKYNGLKANGIEGAFIEFNKSGKGLDTITAAVPHMLVSGDGSERLNKHTLDQGIIGRLAAEAFELDKLYYQLTREEIELIVNASEKGPKEEGEAVSLVFERYEPRRDSRQAPAAAPASNEAAMAAALASVSLSTTPAEVQAPVVQVQAPVVQQAAPAPVVAAPAPTPAPVAAPVAQAAPVVAKQTDDDFLASIGAAPLGK
jgi:hypothetical protein